MTFYRSAPSGATPLTQEYAAVGSRQAFLVFLGRSFLDTPLRLRQNAAAFSFSGSAHEPSWASSRAPCQETTMKASFTNKEISWLSFNDRVLQEASDPGVAALDRLKFLGIFSANMDEFFRVRVATLRRLAKLGKNAKKIIGQDPRKVLQTIQDISLSQYKRFDSIYERLLKELANHKVLVINDKQLTAEQRDFVTSYFRRYVRPNLMPIMLVETSKFPTLRDDSIFLATRFLATRFEPAAEASKARYALIEVPLKGQQRFLLLPSIRGDQFVILIDDVIRCCLKDIFPLFDISTFEAYTIKVTRDAELDLDNDLSESYVRKISRSLKQRKQGNTVRFVYDGRIPAPLLKFLVKKLRLAKEDTHIPGSEYHNFRDFMQFPDVGLPSLREKLPTPVPHKDIHPGRGLIRSMAERDILLHFPYHSFDHLLALLREAAIDPKVTAIKTTLYRMARDSGVVKALINAVRNGKDVTAVVELQARFDEEANIQLAGKLQEEGARVIYGIPGLKVHAKLCLVSRREKRKQTLYAALATGNFNEDTSPVYSDHLLLTADRRLTNEVSSVFRFLENKYLTENYKHLIVSPFNARRKLTKLIQNEIRNAQNGKEARITLKANNLTDPELIRSLYRASVAGVQIRLIVRGMFSLIPGLPNLSENIEGISIVDRFLEHSRIMAFHNGGSPKYFLASGDWMTRNLDGRVEVAFPVYDPDLQNELRAFLGAQWKDNVKARILNKDLDNQYRQTPIEGKTRAQEAIYDFLKALHTGKETEPIDRPGPSPTEAEASSTRAVGASE